MKQFLSFVILFSLVISCTSNTIFKKPDDLISKEIMIDLILDIQLANSSRHIKNIDGKRRKDYMPLVYEKYGVDSTQFARSNFYYSTNIDDYTKLLKVVKDRLDVMEKDYDKQVELLDSLTREEKIEKKKNFKKDAKKLIAPITIDSALVK